MAVTRYQRESAQRFDDWSGTYERSFTWRHFFDPIHRLIESELGELDGARIVDVGCGTGGLLRRLAARGEADLLVGVDESEGMLRVARELARGCDGLEFLRGSAQRLPLEDGTFDVAVSCIAFHHFPDPAGALAEISRVLVPGGKLCVADMCGEGPAARAFLVYGRLCATDTTYYDRAALEQMSTAAGFEVAGLRKIRRFPPAMLLTAANRT